MICEIPMTNIVKKFVLFACMQIIIQNISIIFYVAIFMYENI